MMSLQNRPQPLSLTHPSSLGIPESELGLLASTFSPEGGQHIEEGVAMGVVKEKGVEVEEEYFFSTEVGSFTDINFASRFPHGHTSDAGHKTETGHVTDFGHTTDSGHVSITGPVTDIGDMTGTSGADFGHMTDTSGAGHVTDAGDLTGTGHVEENSEAVLLGGDPAEPFAGNPDDEDPSTVLKQEEVEFLDNEKSTEDDAERMDGGVATKLSIGEAAAIMHSIPQADQSAQSVGAKDEEVVGVGKPAELADVVPGAPVGVVKRTSNSQSWSEDVVVTSPVTITPRPSSYSFSMENLPPLLSYDGGEEFSHSPSLTEGGVTLSEEEQVQSTVIGCRSRS
jgi:hypothetical protein